MAKRKLIKVLLQDRGEDAETPWAEDLGAVRGKRGARRVRLVNVPFLHAKPTYGDVITVVPDPGDGMLTWDAGGVDYDEIHTRIDEDGGRYAAIVDYLPGKGVDARPAYEALSAAARTKKIIAEGCFAPRDRKPGRIYLAVPEPIKPAAVMKLLGTVELAVKLTLVHPTPSKRKKPTAKAKPAAKPKPAKPKPAKPKPAKPKPTKPKPTKK